MLEDETDFEIIDTTVRHELEAPKEEAAGDVSGMLSFDMPLQEQETPKKVEETSVVLEIEEEPVLFNLNEDIAEIEVNEPIEIIR